MRVFKKGLYMSFNTIKLFQRILNNMLDLIEEYVDRKEISDEELIEVISFLRYAKSRSNYKIDDIFSKKPHLL